MNAEKDSRSEETYDSSEASSNTDTSQVSPPKNVKPIVTKMKNLEKKIMDEHYKVKKGALREPILGNQLRDKAIAVILKNAGSPEWNEFMALFDFAPDELERLVPSEKDAEKNEALAYLIGGGVCGATSVDMAGESVECGLFGRVDEETIERP